MTTPVCIARPTTDSSPTHTGADKRSRAGTGSRSCRPGRTEPHQHDERLGQAAKLQHEQPEHHQRDEWHDDAQTALARGHQRVLPGPLEPFAGSAARHGARGTSPTAARARDIGGDVDIRIERRRGRTGQVRRVRHATSPEPSSTRPAEQRERHRLSLPVPTSNCPARSDWWPGVVSHAATGETRTGTVAADHLPRAAGATTLTAAGDQPNAQPHAAAGASGEDARIRGAARDLHLPHVAAGEQERCRRSMRSGSTSWRAAAASSTKVGRVSPPSPS